MSQNAPSSENCSGCLFRLYWMLVGNAVIFTSGAMLAKTGNFALYGSIYLVTLISLIMARYFDIVYFNGQKADYSGPATKGDFHRYAITISIVYVIVLVLLVVFR
jgi:hypothetical protein